ncbi:predicted protein [Lichtheimia corymbifera JMRC:FSU:9682]|uniref:Uncharacterized protein n=1 Tax=Lichtheimia corymbifera JMRC:FSU:9682 TaxID=1263082 RepID=A0A068RHU6_9FUNG|nr:predicted protein [Lichtheimia corymbifera JMRC:FSU:9682]
MAEQRIILQALMDTPPQRYVSTLRNPSGELVRMIKKEHAIELANDIFGRFGWALKIVNINTDYCEFRHGVFSVHVTMVVGIHIALFENEKQNVGSSLQAHNTTGNEQWNCKWCPGFDFLYHKPLHDPVMNPLLEPHDTVPRQEVVLPVQGNDPPQAAVLPVAEEPRGNDPPQVAVLPVVEEPHGSEPQQEAVLPVVEEPHGSEPQQEAVLPVQEPRGSEPQQEAVLPVQEPRGSEPQQEAVLPVQEPRGSEPQQEAVLPVQEPRGSDPQQDPIHESIPLQESGGTPATMQGHHNLRPRHYSHNMVPMSLHPNAASMTATHTPARSEAEEDDLADFTPESVAQFQKRDEAVTQKKQMRNM